VGAEDDGDAGPARPGGEGRLIASHRALDGRRDLRAYQDPADLARAQRIAERLARAIRDRRTRRLRASRRGAGLDLRRMIRASLSRGGEPAELIRRRRADRPMRLVCLLDVSGSMDVYGRVFLAFVRGLLGADRTARAWLFHTRLIDATPALKDGDRLRAADRLSLMASGFGGGTRLSACLRDFLDRHAARAVNRRTVVFILSDGCDADPPARLAATLARLRRRAGRIVWLNPLKGWADYRPTAAAMAAALPHLDAFLPANTLDSLAALEAEFARL
ncbi:MAG: VWA domain-containing protein, partial [Rubrimonas sp.]